MAATFGELPLELVQEITSYLPPSSQIALRLTSRGLYLNTPIPKDFDPKHLALCERMALQRCLHEAQDFKVGKRWCTICRSLQPRHFFHQASTPFCNWHEGWRMRVAPPRRMEGLLARRLYALARSLPDIRWIAVERIVCAGCLAIWDWDVAGQCSCDCPSCGVFTLTCYVRLSSKPNPPHSWHWPRENDAEGKYVLEEHWVGDDSRHRYWTKVPVLTEKEISAAGINLSKWRYSSNCT